MILKPHLLTEVSDANVDDYGTILDDKNADTTGKEAFSFNVVYGTEGHDSPHRNGFRGTDEDDMIITLNGKDVAHGGDGNDVLVGGSAGDQLHGGADSDVLIGGAGNDVLVGDFDSWNGDPNPNEMYADFFIFDIANWGNDIIRDFDDDLDKIVFKAASGVSGFSDLEVNEYIQRGTGKHYTKIEFDDGMGLSSIRLFNFNGTIDQDDFIF